MAALENIHVPQITQEELYQFHETHFSAAALDTYFHATWLAVQQVQQATTDDVCDADAGVNANGRVAPYDAFGDGEPGGVADDEGEVLFDREPPHGSEAPQKKQRRRRKKALKKAFSKSHGTAGGDGSSSTEKPDLRKRTWDIVDTMVPGSLDYDDTAQSLASMPATPQRRRVQYGDDEAW